MLSCEIGGLSKVTEEILLLLLGRFSVLLSFRLVIFELEINDRSKLLPSGINSCLNYPFQIILQHNGLLQFFKSLFLLILKPVLQSNLLIYFPHFLLPIMLLSHIKILQFLNHKQLHFLLTELFTYHNFLLQSL